LKLIFSSDFTKIAAVGKGEIGVAWLCPPQWTLFSNFSMEDFTRLVCSQCSQHSRFIRFLQNERPSLYFRRRDKGAFFKFTQFSDFDNQFPGQTANLICFIARKNQLNPMKIIQLFSC